MKYLSIQQAAEQWGVSPRRVQQLCKSSAIEGAVTFHTAAVSMNRGLDDCL